MSTPPRNAYRTCTKCGQDYLGTTKCPNCGDHTGKSMDRGDDITKKIMEEPDLKKAY